MLALMNLKALPAKDEINDIINDSMYFSLLFIGREPIILSKSRRSIICHICLSNLLRQIDLLAIDKSR